MPHYVCQILEVFLQQNKTTGNDKRFYKIKKVVGKKGLINSKKKWKFLSVEHNGVSQSMEKSIFSEQCAGLLAKPIKPVITYNFVSNL